MITEDKLEDIKTVLDSHNKLILDLKIEAFKNRGVNIVDELQNEVCNLKARIVALENGARNRLNTEVSLDKDFLELKNRIAAIENRPQVVYVPYPVYTQQPQSPPSTIPWYEQTTWRNDATYKAACDGGISPSQYQQGHP